MQQSHGYAVNSGGISMYDFIQRPKEIIDSFASIFRTRNHMLGCMSVPYWLSCQLVSKEDFVVNRCCAYVIVFV